MNTEWKPIASAPKDGKLILLGCPDEGQDGRPALCLTGYWMKGWSDAPDEMGQDDGWVDVQHTDFYPGRSFGNPDYMHKGSQPTLWKPMPAAPGVQSEAPPLTITVDPDPRGVSVGVYQGSSCVYHGAHPIPAGAVTDEGEKPAAYLTLDDEESPCMLFFDLVEARTYCEIGEEPEPLYRRPAPAAGDALDVLVLTQALQDLRQAFVIAVGGKSPFARVALEKADAAIAQQSQRKEA